jgi:hypothetical protein
MEDVAEKGSDWYFREEGTILGNVVESVKPDVQSLST